MIGYNFRILLNERELAGDYLLSTFGKRLCFLFFCLRFPEADARSDPGQVSLAK